MQQDRGIYAVVLQGRFFARQSKPYPLLSLYLQVCLLLSLTPFSLLVIVSNLGNVALLC